MASQPEVVLYLPLNCNACEVVGGFFGVGIFFYLFFFFCSWHDLLKNVREANAYLSF